MNNKPIPIGAGLRVNLTDEGEPVTIGAREDDAITRVAAWIERNPLHADADRARLWLERMEQDHANRELDAKVDRQLKPVMDVVDRHLGRSEELKNSIHEAVRNMRKKT